MDDVRYGTVAGFAAAAAEAHRRRTSAARAGALAVAVVVAMGGTSGLVGRSSSSQQIDPAVPTAEPSWPDDPRPAPSGAALAGARPDPAGAAPGSRPHPGTAPSPPAAPAGREPAASEPEGGPSGPQSTRPTRTSHSSDLSCLAVGTDCTQATWAEKAGGRYEVTATYCSTTERVLRFADDTDVEFRVTGWNRVLWTSLADYPPRPGAHEVHVAGMTCLRWTSVWNGTFNDGRRLPDATYRLVVTVRSPDAVQKNATAVFTIG